MKKHKIHFTDLGHGTEAEILNRIKDSGHHVVIRDDDAAAVGAPCWFSVRHSDRAYVVAQYEGAGGTVSLVTDKVV